MALVVGAGCVMLAIDGALVWLMKIAPWPKDADYASARVENGHIVGRSSPRPHDRGCRRS